MQPCHPEYNLMKPQQKISFLNNIIYYFINYSHINLYQKISENIPYINYLIAFNWALIQAILTYHFFPEILQFIATSFTLSISFQSSILAIAVSATFITIFLVGLSVWNNKEKDGDNLVASINKLLERENSIFVSFSLILILLVTHTLAYGYISEWANQIMLLFPLHPSVSFLICGFAIINLLFFSIERCVSSLDYLVRQPSIFSINNIFMFLSIHVFMFGILGIFNLSTIIISLSGISFVFCYYMKNCDSKKSFVDNLDDILNDWIFLIMHAVSEGAIVGAGIYLSLSSFISNPTILIYLTGLAISASTVCEEMEDLVHHDCEADIGKFASDNAAIPNLANTLYIAGFGKKSLVKLGFTELNNYLFVRDEDLPQKDITFISDILLPKQLKNLGFSNSDILKLEKHSKEDILALGATEQELASEGYYYPLLASKFISFNLTMVLLFITVSSTFNLYTIIIGNAIAATTLVALLLKERNFYKYLSLNSIKFSLAYLIKKIGDNIIYFTCMVTALCVGINGGLEFFHIFGTNINIVLIIAIAGLVVESLVYHDQISNQEEHEHGSLRLFSFITDFNNLILISVLTISSYSFFNLLFFIPGISSYGVYSSVFIFLSLFGREMYSFLTDFITYNKSKNMILSSFLAFCVVGIVLNITSSFYLGVAAFLPIYLGCSPIVFLTIFTAIPMIREYYSGADISRGSMSLGLNEYNDSQGLEAVEPIKTHGSKMPMYCVDSNDPTAVANFLLFDPNGKRDFNSKNKYAINKMCGSDCNGNDCFSGYSHYPNQISR